MTGPEAQRGRAARRRRPADTKATAKYLRGSASKAREVLDLIRGLDVRRADEVLQFTTRDVAKDVRKVLASAVANAVHNDEQDAEELFVLACFADEGPTLRRFRPRARGRATRIRKRTCHITVVVARLSDERLEVLQARQTAQSAAGRRRAGTTAQSRRDRVQRSRTRAQGLRDRCHRATAPEAPAEELPEETPGADVDAVDATEVIADEVAEELEVEAEERPPPTSPRASSPTSPRPTPAERRAEPVRPARGRRRGAGGRVDPGGLRDQGQRQLDEVPRARAAATTTSRSPRSSSTRPSTPRPRATKPPPRTPSEDN